MKLSKFLRGVTKNSLFLHFMTVFMSYYPQFWGLGVIYKVHDTWVHIWEAWPKTHHFCILGPFSWAIAHNFGVP
jgi:hypothetical protein